jgi:CTP:molybdopterin cytidylyltransferase MocA
MSPALLPPDYRVVYLILAHRAPAQVARLVRRLHHRQSRVWVHVDRRADEAAFRRYLAPLGVRFVRDRQAVYWGTFSLVAATRAGLRAIRSAGEGFDHLVVLSGQDYPLVGTQALLTTLAAHRTESLVSYAALGPDNNPHLLSRLTKYHLPLPGQRALVYPFEPGRGNLRAVLNAALRLTGRYPPAPAGTAILGAPVFWLELDTAAARGRRLGTGPAGAVPGHRPVFPPHPGTR